MIFVMNSCLSERSSPSEAALPSTCMGQISRNESAKMCFMAEDSEARGRVRVLRFPNHQEKRRFICNCEADGIRLRVERAGSQGLGFQN